MLLRGLVMAMLVASTGAAPIDPVLHRADVEAWRLGRVGRLLQPDGWLALVGLHWVEPGTPTVGSGPDNDIVLSVGPARLGRVALTDGKLRVELDEGVDARIDGVDARAAELVTDADGTPTFVRFGSANFHVIER